ncbi:hypothetical protein C8R44DRAFT_754643 [Mycena epipterygia]|nr:hypothetical protein C8R44DRAFT_754643 [Mycena epipterygia]
MYEKNSTKGCINRRSCMAKHNHVLSPMWKVIHRMATREKTHLLGCNDQESRLVLLIPLPTLSGVYCHAIPVEAKDKHCACWEEAEWDGHVRTRRSGGSGEIWKSWLETRKGVDAEEARCKKTRQSLIVIFDIRTGERFCAPPAPVVMLEMLTPFCEPVRGNKEAGGHRHQQPFQITGGCMREIRKGWAGQ